MKKRNLVLSSLVLSALFILAGCGGDDGGSSSSPPYSQADLTGTWYVSVLQTGATITGGEPGWIRGWATVDAFGNVIVTSLETKYGEADPSQLPWGIALSINASTGIISETSVTGSTFGNPDFHGKLASNKQLIVGTATNQNVGNGADTMQLRIMQKLVSGVTYSIADLKNKPFMMHQLASGTNTDWGYASGSTSGSAVVTIPTITTSSGPVAAGVVGTMSIHPGTGLVTMSTNSSFLGMMSPDKTYFVATETDQFDSTIYRLTIVQITPSSPSFITSDMAGSWHVHGLINGIPAWIYQTVSIDSLGLATITSQLSSQGTSTILPPPVTLTINGSGLVTLSSDTTFHGTLSAGKDMLVSTQTITDGGFFPTLGVSVK